MHNKWLNKNKTRQLKTLPKQMKTNSTITFQIKPKRFYIHTITKQSQTSHTNETLTIVNLYSSDDFHSSLVVSSPPPASKCPILSSGNSETNPSRPDSISRSNLPPPHPPTIRLTPWDLWRPVRRLSPYGHQSWILW